MGIDITTLSFVLHSLKFEHNKDKLLTLGRQGIHINQDLFEKIGHLYNLDLKNYYTGYNSYCEIFFRSFGFKFIDSIDKNNYENATILHDLNLPIKDNQLYDFIFDGGTCEHIFNAPQLFKNIINMLNINGLYCGVTCNNNYSGHGFYQFSPEFFYGIFNKKYGMIIEDMFLAKNNTLQDEWISVKNSKDIRNEIKFNSLDPVYICILARKISNEKINILDNPPQQHSYENINWI